MIANQLMVSSSGEIARMRSTWKGTRGFFSRSYSICHPERSWTARERAVLRSRGTLCCGGNQQTRRSTVETPVHTRTLHTERKVFRTPHKDRISDPHAALKMTVLGSRESYQPTFIPLFCSSSHFCSGAKYSRIAPASISRWPVRASMASGQGLLWPMSSILLNLRAGFLRSEERAAVQRTLYIPTRGRARDRTGIRKCRRGNNACTAHSRPRDTSRPDRNPPRCAPPEAQSPDTSAAAPTRLCCNPPV